MARMVVMALHCSTGIEPRGCIMRAGGTPKLRRCAMYKSFRVKNFRCFKDLQINDLGRVNLIAGKNNTGKTALLEAMYLHTRPQQPETILDLQQARGLDTPDYDLPLYWQHFFHELDETEQIEMDGDNSEYNHKLIMYHLNRKDDIDDHFRRSYNILLDMGHDDDEAFRRKNLIYAAVIMQCEESQSSRSFSYLFSDGTHGPLTDVILRSNFITVQGRPNKRISTKQFTEVVRKRRLQKLVETLSSLDAQLSDLRALESYREQLTWADVKWGFVPLKLMGEGVNRVNHILLTLASNPNGYVFIDEIENGVHHSAYEDVWKAIGQVARDPELNIQVFATTHSLEMIEAANEAFKDDDFDDFRFHRLYRDSTTGNVEARTYNEFSIDAAISRDREVRG